MKKVQKQMERDKEDLLNLGGSIYENAFLHFSAFSLKLCFRSQFCPGDMEFNFEP